MLAAGEGVKTTVPVVPPGSSDDFPMDSSESRRPIFGEPIGGLSASASCGGMKASRSREDDTCGSAVEDDWRLATVVPS